MIGIRRFRLKLLHHLIIPLFLLSGFSCTSEDENFETENDEGEIAAHIETDVPYGKHPGQTYDIYLPANRSSSETKVLVFVHGGGWIGGDKKDMDPYVPILQNNHPYHAIVNLNYRLAQPPTQPAFPDQFLDLHKALEQISVKAEELKIQPIFGIIGVSAGGHLALQYDALYDVHERVEMVCSIVGPTDLTDPFYKSSSEFKVAIDLLVDEDSYPGITNYARAVSPLYHISDKSSATILFYGEKDPLVPVRSGIALKEQLDTFKIFNSLTIFDGGHGDWEKKENDLLQLKLSSFIETYLPVY